MQVEQLSEMKKKHLKAIKKQDQDIRAKKAVGIWKRRTWKRGMSRKGSGAVTPVTAPVTRAGSEDEEGDDEDADEDGDGADGDEDGEEKIMPIRRRSEGVTADVCITYPIHIHINLIPQKQADHIITHHSSLLPHCLPDLLRPQTHHHPVARRLLLR